MLLQVYYGQDDDINTWPYLIGCAFIYFWYWWFTSSKKNTTSNEVIKKKSEPDINTEIARKATKNELTYDVKPMQVEQSISEKPIKSKIELSGAFANIASKKATTDSATLKDTVNKDLEIESKAVTITSVAPSIKQNIKTTIVGVESNQDGKQISLKLANGDTKQYPISYINKVLGSNFLSDALPTILIDTEVTYDTRTYSKGDQIRIEKDDSPIISKHTNKPIFRTSDGVEIIKFRFGSISGNAVDRHHYDNMASQVMDKLDSKNYDDAISNESGAQTDGLTESDRAKRKAESLAKFKAFLTNIKTSDIEQQKESFEAEDESL